MAAAVSFTMHDCIAYDTAVENKFRGQVGKCLIDALLGQVEAPARQMSGNPTNQLPAIPIRRSTRLTANYWLLGEIALTASDLTEDRNAKATALKKKARPTSILNAQW